MRKMQVFQKNFLILYVLKYRILLISSILFIGVLKSIFLANALGGGPVKFTPCNDQYKICRDLSAVLSRQKDSYKGPFMVGWSNGALFSGQLEDAENQSAVMVLMARSVDACKTNDCLLILLHQKKQEWEVEFTSPTVGDVQFFTHQVSFEDGSSFGLGFVVKSSLGYLFYHKENGQYRLVNIIINAMN